MKAHSHRRRSGYGSAGAPGVLLGFVGLCVVLAALAGPASAQSVTFSDTAALSGVNISGTLSVPKFDPALGVLLAVEWEITGDIATILGIENNSASSITANAFVDVDFDVDSTLLPLAASPDFDVVTSTGLITLGIGESALFPVTASDSISGSESPSAAFLLPGTVDVTYLTSTSFGATSVGGDATVSHATDAGILLEVTYVYFIPEPASLASIGLAGLLLTRRRH